MVNGVRSPRSQFVLVVARPVDIGASADSSLCLEQLSLPLQRAIGQKDR